MGTKRNKRRRLRDAGILVGGAVLSVGLACFIYASRAPSGVSLVASQVLSPAIPVAPLRGGEAAEAVWGRVTPSSPKYRPEAFWVVRKAIDDAGRAIREGHADRAVTILESDTVAGASGVIVERYPGARVDGPLDENGWIDLGASLFDTTYCIGQVGHRGIIMGNVVLPTATEKAFPDVRTRERFFTIRALSLMEPWIRVLQDIRSLQPVSETTVRFVRDTGNTTSWSSVDVIATYAELDLDVPERLKNDPRFPRWAEFWKWHLRDASYVAKR